MSRLRFVAPLLGALLLGSTLAHAADAPATHSVPLTLAHLSRYHAAPLAVPRAQAPAPAGQTSGPITSSSQLKLPSSAFPITFNLVLSQTVSADQADDYTSNNATVIGTINHLGATGGFSSANLKDMGMLGGFAQEASYSIPSSTHIEYLAYLGSYYQSSTQAQQAFQQIATTLSAFQGAGYGTGSACQFPGASGCYEVDKIANAPQFVLNSGGYDVDVRVLVRGNAVFEGAGLVSQFDYNTLDAQIRADLDGMSNGFNSLFQQNQPVSTPLPTTPPVATTPPISTPTPQPTTPPSPTPTPTQVSTQYSLLGVGVAKHGASKLGKSFKRGTKLDLVIGFDVTSAPANASVKLAFLVLLGKKKVLSKTESGTLNQTGQDVEGITHTFKKVGTYTFAAGVSINGGALQAAKTTFKITK